MTTTTTTTMTMTTTKTTMTNNNNSITVSTEASKVLVSIKGTQHSDIKDIYHISLGINTTKTNNSNNNNSIGTSSNGSYSSNSSNSSATAIKHQLRICPKGMYLLLLLTVRVLCFMFIYDIILREGFCDL